MHRALCVNTIWCSLTLSSYLDCPSFRLTLIPLLKDDKARKMRIRQTSEVFRHIANSSKESLRSLEQLNGNNFPYDVNMSSIEEGDDLPRAWGNLTSGRFQCSSPPDDMTAESQLPRIDNSILSSRKMPHDHPLWARKMKHDHPLWESTNELHQRCASRRLFPLEEKLPQSRWCYNGMLTNECLDSRFTTDSQLDLSRFTWALIQTAIIGGTVVVAPSIRGPIPGSLSQSFSDRDENSTGWYSPAIFEMELWFASVQWEGVGFLLRFPKPTAKKGSIM